MNKIKNFVRNPDLGLLIFRLFVGLSMAFAHGLGKLPPPPQLVEGLTAMGLPMPGIMSWLVALAEFGGGLMIAIGLCTRFGAAIVGVTMLGAAFVVHAADPFKVKELAFFYLVSCVLLIFTGAGRYSLDSKICKK